MDHILPRAARASPRRIGKSFWTSFQFRRHSERCSGHSAAAYAKSTGKFGVVQASGNGAHCPSECFLASSKAIVTSGPGLTNLVTPMQAQGIVRYGEKLLNEERDSRARVDLNKLRV